MVVLEGEASVLVGNEVTLIKTGGWHLRPHGSVHVLECTRQTAAFY
jgi:hypothetical protein